MALVVGGGGEGLGAAISRALADAGARVAVADCDPGAPFVVDVRDTAEVEAMVSDVTHAFGTIDVLVNNVGGSNAFLPRKSVLEYTEDDWDLILSLNLRYVFVTCKAVLPVMLEAGRGGSIVNVCSIIGSRISGPMRVGYGAAKAGLKHLTQTLAVECGPHAIRVNSVSPGHIRTAAATGATTANPADTVPLRRHGVPHEIANAVLFLASDLSSYVNGADLVVDGGASVTNVFELHPTLKEA